MRIHRIKLGGFGTFNRGIDIDFGSDRLGVIIGRNEAGKSTIMSAIFGVLFGFKDSSIQQKFAIRAGQRLVSWLPTFHDMGLAFGVLIPPYSGTHAYLMSPLDFGRRPARWVEAMSRYQASGTGGPNFAYDLCARKISPVELEALDLSRWELAFNGAEPVRAATLARFTEVFGPRGFKHEAHFPCYGLAESTCMVTGGVFEAAPVVLELDTRAHSQDGQTFSNLAPGLYRVDVKTRYDEGEAHRVTGSEKVYLEPGADEDLTVVAIDHPGDN